MLRNTTPVHGIDLAARCLFPQHILVLRYNHERKGEKDDADREEERGTILYASDLTGPEPPWDPTLERTLERGSHPIQ
jgi:hypothetical protein